VADNKVLKVTKRYWIAQAKDGDGVVRTRKINKRTGKVKVLNAGRNLV